jgi:hypothetical protein
MRRTPLPNWAAILGGVGRTQVMDTARPASFFAQQVSTAGFTAA